MQKWDMGLTLWKGTHRSRDLGCVCVCLRGVGEGGGAGMADW